MTVPWQILTPANRAAITLAIEIQADLLLADDRGAAKAARTKGFKVAGTLAILSMAARHNLINLAGAFDHLKRTSFHYRQEIIDQFLAEHRDKK
jgi:predicted nucleic acid-binding protein